MEENSAGSMIRKIVGQCPEQNVRVQGCDISCLLDTGAQVSTITEQFYRQHLSHQELVDISQLVSVTGTQGHDVPFLGCVELDLEVMGEKFPSVWFVVVRDPQGTPIAERKQLVPGVIGSNAFQEMREVLQERWGQHYIQSLEQQPDGRRLASVLALYEEHRAANLAEGPRRVRLIGDKPVLIPARSIKTVEGTVRPASGGQVYQGIVEECCALPTGLSVGPTVVAVDKGGTIPCCVANLSNEDMYLQPRAHIGMLEVMAGHPETTTTDEHMETLSTERECEEPDVMSRLKLGDDINLEGRTCLEDLVRKYHSVFSENEDDVGCCNLVEHHIRTKDQIPVRVPHRRIPPHQWSEVRQYIQRATERGIIQE